MILNKLLKLTRLSNLLSYIKPVDTDIVYLLIFYFLVWWHVCAVGLPPGNIILQS